MLRHVMVPLPDHPSATLAFAQLAAQLTLAFTVILIATMGTVNGLRFRRVYIGLGTVRGVPAQIIGAMCLLADLAGIGLLIGYIALLRRYCGANADCLVTTPVAIVLANWPVIIWNAMWVFVFIRWALQRHEEIVVLTGAYSFALPSVYHYVNGILSLSHEHRMSRPEVQQIMDYMQRQAPAVVLGEVQQIMDGKRIDAEKLMAALLTEAPFRDQGERGEIALAAIVEAYVDSDKSPVPLPNPL